MPITLTRSLMVILVPGLIALAPWLMFVMYRWPGAAELYNRHSALANVGLFAAVVICGAAFEGLGSSLEARWDRKREAEFQVRENWFSYLARTPPEPVGHRYISRMVTTLYFELSMAWATAIFFGACGALAMLLGLPNWAPFVSFAFAIAGVVYFRWQASCTHKVLCETRAELNRRASGTTGLPTSP